jgi:hypothetical protein
MGDESPQDSRKPICVVVDTSVWRAEPLLKTPLGVTLVYTLSRRGGFVGLPEVVELEFKKQIVEAGLEAANKARGPLHMLHTLTDNPFFGTELPTQDKLSQIVNERMAQLAPVLIREPFTVEHAKAALAMVNSKLPPNGEKSQQFKDSAIWQAVLALSLRYSTVLLTNDKAFFRNRNPASGLAENLVDDCTNAGTAVKGFDGIGPYLKTLKGDEPEFDRERAKELIVAVVMPRLKLEAERCMCVPTELLHASIEAFPTESSDRLAIDYTLTFNLECVSPEYRAAQGTPDRGIVHGSGYFVPEDNNLTDHYIQRIALIGRGRRGARDFKDYYDSFAIPRPLSWD